MSSVDDAKSAGVGELLRQQFEIAWALAWYHLETLTTEECLWRPADRCLDIHLDGAGNWVADWPSHEGYEIGPPSIGWTTWHICFWWRKALEHVQGKTDLDHSDVLWPGSATQVREQLWVFREDWLDLLSNPEGCLQEPRTHSWPLQDASLAATAAWLNVELSKNAAEVGLVRFLHAVSS